MDGILTNLLLKITEAESKLYNLFSFGSTVEIIKKVFLPFLILFIVIFFIIIAIKVLSKSEEDFDIFKEIRTLIFKILLFSFGLPIIVICENVFIKYIPYSLSSINMNSLFQDSKNIDSKVLKELENLKLNSSSLLILDQEAYLMAEKDATNVVLSLKEKDRLEEIKSRTASEIKDIEVSEKISDTPLQIPSQDSLNFFAKGVLVLIKFVVGIVLMILVFFVKAIQFSFLMIGKILFPLAIILSLVPIFKDALVKWATAYIGILLWSVTIACIEFVNSIMTTYVYNGSGGEWILVGFMLLQISLYTMIPTITTMYLAGNESASGATSNMLGGLAKVSGLGTIMAVSKYADKKIGSYKDFKDDKGNALSVSGKIGNTIENKIKDIFGGKKTKGE